MDSLVDVAWLQANLDDPNLRVLDCTVAFELGDGGTLSFFTGRADWEKAHIPGSGFADIIGELSDTTSPHLFTLPSTDLFGQAMEKLGVGSGKRVVLYDATFSMWATRVWWMLKAFGFDDVAVLDGGLTAWQAAGEQVTDTPTSVAAEVFNAELQPGWFVETTDMEDTVAALGSACIIDALMPEMYAGTQKPYTRAGHIPGALNVPAVSVVDQETRLFLDEETLKKTFSTALNSPDQPVITYCGGGIAATADAFLLHRLGKTKVAVYDGSMAEWTSDAARPLVLGKRPS